MGYQSLDNNNCYQHLMFDDVYITVKHRISHTTYCPMICSTIDKRLSFIHCFCYPDEG